MRTLPVNVQNLLNTGVFEPISVLRIYWSDTPVLYGDTENEDLHIKGKILSLSDIEDVRDLNKGVFDVQFELTLDDTDGEIQNIIAQRDITGVRVELLQWFGELNFSDAFKIFEGAIASPIRYSNGANNITFTVMNKLENREFGFSAEEGQFEYLPPNMIGQAWPIVFGKVASVPLPQIAESPSAVIVEGFGIVNQTAWAVEINQLQSERTQALNNAQAAFALHLKEAYRAAQFEDPFGFASFGVSNDPTQARSHREASLQALVQSEAYARDAVTIQAKLTEKLAEKAEQESYQRDWVTVVGTNLPQQVPLSFKLSGVTLTGILNGNILQFTSKSVDGVPNSQKPLYMQTNTETLITHASQENSVGDKFYWIDAGTKIDMKNFVLSFVVSATQVSVAAIKAKQRGVYVKIPTSYYTIEYPTYTSQLTGQSITPTILRLHEPLTSKNDPSLGINWDDNLLYADLESTVPANVVDILIWIIQNYTTLSYDAASFNHVKTLVDKYKANFAVLQRINSIELLRQICYQARLAIWTNDETFYLRYLPEKQTPVATITKDDIELNTLDLLGEINEDLVTKYIATWKPSLDYPEPFKIIYRSNIQKYGTQEREYDFYIYNNVESVMKSAEYWSIKQSNNWKRITFNVSYQKFSLEAFDPVTIDIGQDWISSAPVVGIIERAILSTENDKISLTVWLPIRFGENTEYVFATPKDVFQKYPRTTDTQFQTGNPFQRVSGKLVDKTNVLGNTAFGAGTNYVTSNSDFFEPTEIADAADSSVAHGTVSTYLNPLEITNTRPTSLALYNDGVRYEVKPYVPVEVPPPTSGSFYGVVLDHIGGGRYLVDVYLKGPSANPTTQTVLQIPHNDDDLIGAGTTAQVIRLSKNDNGVSYIMFVPVWVYE